MPDVAVFQKMEEVLEEVTDQIEKYKQKPKEDRKFYDLPVLVFQAVVEVVEVANDVLDEAKDKKEATVEALHRFYVKHIQPLDIPGVPNIIERPMERYAARTVIALLVELAVGLKHK